MKFKGFVVDRIVKAPEPRLGEGEEGANILLNFFYDLGWNPKTHLLDPKRIRTTPAVFSRISDAILENVPDTTGVNMLMLNKGPSGGHEDIKKDMVVLLRGWEIPIENKART